MLRHPNTTQIFVITDHLHSLFQFVHAGDKESHQCALLSERVFEGDRLQTQMLLDSQHVGLPGRLQQTVTSELVC